MDGQPKVALAFLWLRIPVSSPIRARLVSLASMAQISAPALIDAMARVRPDAGVILAKFSEKICSGEITSPHAFVDLVSAELGGTVLLDALLLLKGAPMTTPKSAGEVPLRAKLLRHAMACPANTSTTSCPIPGCSAMAQMVHTLRAHASNCREATTCRTCIRWHNLLCTSREHGIQLLPARSTKPIVCQAVRPMVAMSVAPNQPSADDVSSNSSTDMAAEKRSNAGLLMMLARSALGEVSAPNSPRNSPTPSPEPQRLTQKRHKGLNGSDGREGVRSSSPLRPVARRKGAGPGASHLSALAAASNVRNER